MMYEPNPELFTKQREYERSAELFAEICKTQDPLFALAFIYDSQYDRKDMGAIIEILTKEFNKK